MMKMSAAERTTRATRKMPESLGLMTTLITSEATSEIGARVAMMSDMLKAFCTLVTSVVMRVTRPAVLNLSMFEKLYVCTFSKSASRRFDARPVEAREPKTADAESMTSATTAQPSMTPPYSQTLSMAPFEMP